MRKKCAGGLRNSYNAVGMTSFLYRCDNDATYTMCKKEEKTE